MKVLVYNSSARGSGQFVRSLKIARVITDSFRDARFVVLAGNSRVERSVPDRTVIMPMPEIRKSFSGDYLLGTLSVADPDNIAEAFAARGRIIQSTIDEFDPDVFLVDSRPEGLNGELVDMLGQLARASRCRTVLMLRDIVDDPALVTGRWEKHGIDRLIGDVYDDVVIWGDEQTFDAVAAYRLSPFRHKVSYLGYLGSGLLPPLGGQGNDAADASGRILVTVGGGFDGNGIIETVYEYLCRALPTNRRLRFTLVLGAHSPVNLTDLVERLRGTNGNVKVYGHVPDLEGLISAADVVVSMCGYNTLLEGRKKIIAIPRSHSGAEQTMRARLLSARYDGMWVIPENELTADALERCLGSALRAQRPETRIEIRGAANLVAFLSGEVRVA